MEGSFQDHEKSFEEFERKLLGSAGKKEKKIDRGKYIQEKRDFETEVGIVNEKTDQKYIDFLEKERIELRDEINSLKENNSKLREILRKMQYLHQREIKNINNEQEKIYRNQNELKSFLNHIFTTYLTQKQQESELKNLSKANDNLQTKIKKYDRLKSLIHQKNSNNQNIHPEENLFKYLSNKEKL